jgi:hypothetical protein
MEWGGRRSTFEGSAKAAFERRPFFKSTAAPVLAVSVESIMRRDWNALGASIQSRLTKDAHSRFHACSHFYSRE